MAALRNELTQPWKFGKTNQIFVSESLTKFVELWGMGVENPQPLILNAGTERPGLISQLF